MSMWLATQVWFRKLDKTRMVILMALCDSAEDDGTSCYPSPGYIKWKTGSSLPTVYRIMADLEAKGVLEPVGSKGDITEYAIHLDKVPLKERYDRPKRGRPRKDKAEKHSHGENVLSPREKILTVRKVLSPREKDSHGEKKPYHGEKQKRRLDPSPEPADSGLASKQDAPELCISNLPYELGIENSGASPTFNQWIEAPERRELRVTKRMSEKIVAYRVWCTQNGLAAQL